MLASSKETVKASVVRSSRGKVDATARLAVLKSRLFRAVCRRVCKGLLNRDRLLFALRLAQVRAPCKLSALGGNSLGGRYWLYSQF